MLFDVTPVDEISVDPTSDNLGVRFCIGCGALFTPQINNQTRCKRDCKAKDRHKNRLTLDRPFIAIDGEGGGKNKHGQQNYLLMRARGISDETAHVLFNDNKRLTTIDCLEFILSLPSNQHAHLVGFFFDYDVTQILRDLSTYQKDRVLRGRPAFRSDGSRASQYVWIELDGRNYGIRYVPKQFLSVARQIKDPITEKISTVPESARTINEVGGFFQKAFAKVIREWKVADDDTITMIERNKELRPEFDVITSEILRYCDEECRLLADVMTRFRSHCIDGTEKVRDVLNNNQISLISKLWRGAGHLAAKMHDSAGSPKRKDLPEWNPDLYNMMVEAYYGGHFEISKVGHIKKKIYEFDINSAYPAAMQELPCALCTQWISVSEPDAGSLYIADIIFDHPVNNVWCGFPFRTETGHLHWPRKGSGVYWSVEIEAAQLLGAEIKFNKVWQAVKTCDHRPFSWVEPLYEFRKSLDKGTVGYPIKLGLNALYGKLAQRKGAQTYYNIMWAGLITAVTRAKLLSAVAHNPEAVVMLATDGVYSTCELPLQIGTALGTWEKKEHPDMFIVQPGMYWFPEAPAAEASHKTRGIPKSIVQKNVDRFRNTFEQFMYEKLITKFNREVPFVTVSVNTFIGVSLGLQMANTQPYAMGSWIERPRKISFDWSNKRGKHRPNLSGTYIDTLPHVGEIDKRSSPYDPKKLTMVEDQRIEYEGMPDHMDILNPDGVPEFVNLPDDE